MKRNFESPNLTKAAEILLAHFKTPDKLIEFAAEALLWIKNYEEKNPRTDENKSMFFDTWLLIGEVALRWMRDPNAIEGIKKGLDELSGMNGVDGVYDTHLEVLQAYAYNLDYGRPYKHLEILSDINLIAELIEPLRAYEQEDKKQVA